jgi:hypothetical protein
VLAAGTLVSELTVVSTGVIKYGFDAKKPTRVKALSVMVFN